MALRDEIQKKVERKEQEIAKLGRTFEVQLASAKAYVQALQDLLKTLPRDPAEQRRKSSLVLRPNSAMAQAREAILAAGKPLHVTELLTALGRPVDSANKVTLTGSLANYVRKGEIFTRPAPNTFGLIELGHRRETLPSEPPEGFGAVRPRKGSFLRARR